MIKFILGISITLNVISAIAFFIIYKYSLRGVKNRIEDMAIKNFTDFDFDLDDLDKKLKEVDKIL